MTAKADHCLRIFSCPHTYRIFSYSYMYITVRWWGHLGKLPELLRLDYIQYVSPATRHTWSLLLAQNSCPPFASTRNVFYVHKTMSYHAVAPLAGASSRSPVLLTIDPVLTEAGAEALGGLLFLSSYRYIGTYVGVLLHNHSIMMGIVS